MNTGITRFKKGNKIGKLKSGRKHIKTLFKESLQKSISELDNRLYELSCEFLNSKNQKIRFAAWKELVKYRLYRKIESEDKDDKKVEVKIMYGTESEEEYYKRLEADGIDISKYKEKLRINEEMKRR